MKMVINKCFGGFSVSESLAKTLGLDSPYSYIDRTNERLIEAVETTNDFNGRCAKLRVVEIPDCATDWELNEYDGFESITYVVGGKLHHI